MCTCMVLDYVKFTSELSRIWITDIVGGATASLCRLGKKNSRPGGGIRIIDIAAALPADRDSGCISIVQRY